MEIKIVNESGLEAGLIGMKFSFQPECSLSDIAKSYCTRYTDTIHKTMETAKKLCKRDGGHNKFLRCISVWAMMRMPRYWWPEMDQYKVGTTTVSKSTVHTGLKRHYTQDDFEDDVSDHVLNELNFWVDKKDLMMVKKKLPESFLQTRLWHTNYAVIRNVLLQRKGHRVKEEWQYFEMEMLRQLNNPELLGIDHNEVGLGE